MLPNDATERMRIVFFLYGYFNFKEQKFPFSFAYLLKKDEICNAFKQNITNTFK